MGYLYTGGARPYKEAGQGGNFEFYLHNYVRTDTFTLASEGLVGTFSATASYLSFEQDVETSSFNEEQDKPNGVSSGSVAWTQTVEITLNNVSVTDRNKIKQLSIGWFRIITKDNNGNYRHIGHTRGARATSIVFTGGKSTSEGNMCVITFTAREGEPAMFCTTSAVLSAIAPIV